MPTYQMRAPDGNMYRIDGPDGATDDQVRAEIIRQNPQLGDAAPAAPTPPSSVPSANLSPAGELKQNGMTEPSVAEKLGTLASLWDSAGSVFGKAGQYSPLDVALMAVSGKPLPPTVPDAQAKQYGDWTRNAAALGLAAPLLGPALGAGAQGVQAAERGAQSIEALAKAYPWLSKAALALLGAAGFGGASKYFGGH